MRRNRQRCGRSRHVLVHTAAAAISCKARYIKSNGNYTYTKWGGFRGTWMSVSTYEHIKLINLHPDFPDAHAWRSSFWRRSAALRHVSEDATVSGLDIHGSMAVVSDTVFGPYQQGNHWPEQMVQIKNCIQRNTHTHATRHSCPKMEASQPANVSRQGSALQPLHTRGEIECSIKLQLGAGHTLFPHSLILSITSCALIYDKGKKASHATPVQSHPV
ncbi:hypothetical protein V8C43DRAFT_153228 [Trichoderma afarasin]